MAAALLLLCLAAFPACAPRHRPALSSEVAEPRGGGAAAESPAPPDFEKEIRPLLETRCSPCHFSGGKMYDRLPFDRPATIVELGTRLFTRITDEKDQDLLRTYLAAAPGR